MKWKLLLLSVLVAGATEQDVTPEGTCGGVGSIEAGKAFFEPAGRVRQVMNPEPGAVTVYWATISPQRGVDINFVENGPTCTS